MNSSGVSKKHHTEHDAGVHRGSTRIIILVVSIKIREIQIVFDYIVQRVLERAGDELCFKIDSDETGLLAVVTTIVCYDESSVKHQDSIQEGRCLDGFYTA